MGVMGALPPKKSLNENQGGIYMAKAVFVSITPHSLNGRASGCELEGPGSIPGGEADLP